MRMPTKGTRSPTRTYQVRVVEAAIRPARIASANRSVRDTTAPLGSMTALTPEAPASTTQRPVSTARILLICRCCSEAAVNPYATLLTGTTRKLAPASTAARGSSGNAFSKQIGVAKGGTPASRNTVRISPGRRSTGIALSASMNPRRSRQGTYSPNGTRCVLS